VDVSLQFVGAENAWWRGTCRWRTRLLRKQQPINEDVQGQQAGYHEEPNNDENARIKCRHCYIERPF